MTERKIPVACVQLRAHDRGAFERRWPGVVASVRSAASGGAKLIVLPEGTVPAYVLGTQPVAAEQVAAAHEALCGLARELDTTIVYGGALPGPAGTFNAARVVGPRGDLGFAAKQFLWHFDRRWFARGTTLDPIDTPAGRLGVLVCADGRIPTIAATLVDRGAELLVMPTAWVTSGRDPAALENLQADLLALVRARENGVAFVAANKCGVELESVAYCGKSAIVDATGAFVARASERDETVLVGDVAVGSARPSRAGGAALGTSGAPGPARAMRVAFASVAPHEVERFAGLAADADADVLVVPEAPDGAVRLRGVAVVATSSAPRVADADGFRLGIAGDATFAAPDGLAGARLAGVDAFAWNAAGDAAWHVPFARARAAELRAYTVTFSRDGRAFACDPDGAVVAGTYDDFRMAAFGYDPARTRSGFVAPHTDAFEGLRRAAAIRDGHGVLSR